MIGESDSYLNDTHNESQAHMSQDNPFIVSSPEVRTQRKKQNGNLRTSWDQTDAHTEQTDAHTKRKTVTAKRLTVPKSPNFSKRLKIDMSKSTKRAETNDNDGLIARRRNRTNLFDLTVPKPFKLMTSVRGRQLGTTQSSTMPKSPFVSMASRVNNFFTKTPERFKAKPTNKPSANIFQSRLTVPKSPKLRTKVRAKYSVNSDPQDGAKMVKPQKPRTHLKVNGLTIPRSPNITKVTKRKLVSEENMETKPATKPSKRWNGVTIPKSPNITKPSKRRRIDFDVADRPAPKPIARTKKANGLTIPKSPNITKPRPKPPVVSEITRSRLRRKKDVNVHMPGITVPEPFNFVGDSIRERKLQRFREKLQREQEEAERLRHVQANPMLDLEYPDPLPPVEPRPLTKPMPFRLETDLRGAAYQQFLQDKLKRDEQNAKQMAIPRANPMPDFSNVWYPDHSDRAYTIPEEVHLSTEDRIQERRDWEALVEREKEKNAAVWEEKRQEQMKENQKKLQKFRRTLVHKPVPIPETLYRSDPLPRPPQRKLTIPESPAIHKKSVKSHTHLNNSTSNPSKSKKVKAWL